MLKIIRNDITRMQVDAIVNTANEQPVYSAGTDTAVYLAAGAEELLAERKKIGVMAEGEVAVTPGFGLPAKYIIHAVSPRYDRDSAVAEEKLRSCYQKSLSSARELGCESIAFPLIATGSYGYPKEEGMRIALDEINAFLLDHEMMIYLVVFDEKATDLGRKLYPDLEAYINKNYVEKKQETEYGEFAEYLRRDAAKQEARSFCLNALRADARSARERDEEAIDPFEAFEASGAFCDSAPKECSKKKKLAKAKVPECAPAEQSEKNVEPILSDAACMEANDDYDRFIEESENAIKERLNHLSDTFQEYLLYLIESKGLTNADVYKRALLTKQLFSKIKLNPDYHPDKATAMRLCIGAKLNLDETKDLLARAGYALSPCEKRDVIFSYFIEKGMYDMIEIDIALEEHGVECFIAL